jgi:hypothetical protein
MSVKPVFKLDGAVTIPPKDWGGISILATFDDNGGQANISTEEFVFVNENAVKIRNYILGGLTGTSVGIFEGLPFSIELQNGTSYNAFEGFLDLNEFVELDPVHVKCKIKKDQGLNALSDRAAGLTYRYLYSIGALTQGDFTDIPYVREKPANQTIAEASILAVTLFLMAKQLADIVKEISKDVAAIIAHFTDYPPNPLGSIIWTIAVALINTIYAALITIYLIQLTIDLIDLLIPPTRLWRGCKIKTLIEKALTYLGYSYSSSISELNNMYYLPSKNDEGRRFILSPSTTALGIPDTVDFGYTLSEMLELVNRMFSAQLTIIGNTVHQEPLINDSFWLSLSTYQLPDVENEVKLYNTKDLEGRYLVSFDTDLTDEWTIINFLGTNYEVVTQPTVINNKKRVLTTGFGETRIPMALPNRKDKLSLLEESVLKVAQVIDGVVNFFGGSSNQAARIKSRVGLLKVTGDNTQTAKLVLMDAGGSFGYTIPTNHRDILNAKYLWLNYVSDRSFVLHGKRGQKRLFKDLKIPFGFTDFLQLINNSYCITHTGQRAKIEKIAWSFDQDFAVIDGWIREPYTNNLTEYEHQGSTDAV